MVRNLPVLLALMFAAACATRRGYAPSAAHCAAPSPDSANQTIYALARELLVSPNASALRQEHGIHGSGEDVRWLMDDKLCAQIASTLGRKVGDPPPAAVWIGDHILAQLQPPISAYVFDGRGRLVTAFIR